MSRVSQHGGSSQPAVSTDDATIVGRMAGGDQSALGELYDRHARAVYSLSSRILSDRHEAEDVVQDVFSQAWAQAARYEPARGAVLTWLLVIARGRAIDRLRARRGRAASIDSRQSEASDPAPGQELIAMTAQQVGRLKVALAALADGQRKAIELAYFDDLSQSEIAARLQEPLGTIKTRIRSGLQRLRAALESE